jgi:hypothetical protein
MCGEDELKSPLKLNQEFTQRVPLLEQELLTIPSHPSSHLAFSEVHVTRSLVLCVVFCRSLFVS